MFDRPSRLALGLVLLLALAGCGGSGETVKVDYAVSAQTNYARGLDALEKEDWSAAAKYFSFIKARFAR